MTKRKRNSAEFKAKVAFEAIREELTAAELAEEYDAHPTMITAWKRTAILKMSSAFDDKNAAEPKTVTGLVRKG
nr:transposase [Paracoccus liaowanqingii]